jgi:ankyrin repeat protein
VEFKQPFYYKEINNMARAKQSLKRKHDDKQENLSEEPALKKQKLNEELITIARQGHFEKVKQLVEQGADVNQEFGEPLEAAIKSGQLEIVQYLIENGAEIDRSATYGGIPPLHLAVKKGQQAIAEYLLTQDADIDEVEPYDSGGTPLIIAVNNGDFSMMTFLLEQGANIQVRHKDGDSPVCFAISSGRFDMVKQMLKFTDDAIFKGKLVTIAAGSDLLETVRYLIEQGADINYTPDTVEAMDDDDNGLFYCFDTPLIAAVPNYYRNYILSNFTVDEVAQLKTLTADTCDIVAKINLAETDYKLISFTEDDEIALKTVLAQQDSYEAKKLRAKLANSDDIFKYLLAKGANVATKGDGGSTALHECISYNAVELAKLLIIYSALAELQQGNAVSLLEIEDDEGKTPLDCDSTSPELIEKVETFYKQRFFLANQWKMAQERPSFFKSYTAPIPNQPVDKEQFCEIRFST